MTRARPRFIPQRPPWMRDALCLEYPVKWWYVSPYQSGKKGKDVCKRCLVRQECLTHAIESVERYGIWAGFDHHDFRRWHRYRECRLCHDPIPFAEVAALVLDKVEVGRWCCQRCREIQIRELGVAV